jgi:hypothetical protein
MTEDEITQIKVGRHRMGIIGLKHVLEEVSREFDDRSDNAVSAVDRLFYGNLKNLSGCPMNKTK